MSDLEISEDHPLSLELQSLRAAVARYQHEAHAAAVKLQRHSLETSQAIEHSHALEHENARLREEIAALRATPDVTPHPASLQVPELTLALRRLSDKLTFTEETLVSRTTELTHARSDLLQAQSDAEAAHALTVKVYIEMEHSRARERELERKVKAAEEERRLADLVVQEYADLVRSIEGRKSKSPTSPAAPIHGNASSSSVTLTETLAEGKLGLQKLLGEHDTQTERLAAQLTKLADENEILTTKLDVERKRSEADRESLARVLLELDKHRTDDSTATKMVSRYMKFSQSTIDSLQQAMDNIRKRHASTLATLNAQIEYLQKALASERRQAEKLRDTLDELSEDISRESYGRRREVALRLSFLAREEGLAENLRRWLRRSKETMDRSLSQPAEQDTNAVHDIFEHMLHDAELLLESLNGQFTLTGDTPASVARLLVAQDHVAALTRELHVEQDMRIRLQRQIAEIDAPVTAEVAENPFVLSVPPPRQASLGKVAKQDAEPTESSTASAAVPTTGTEEGVIASPAVVQIDSQPSPLSAGPPTSAASSEKVVFPEQQNVDTPALVIPDTPLSQPDEHPAATSSATASHAEVPVATELSQMASPAEMQTPADKSLSPIVDTPAKAEEPTATVSDSPPPEEKTSSLPPLEDHRGEAEQLPVEPLSSLDAHFVSTTQSPAIDGPISTTQDIFYSPSREAAAASENIVLTSEQAAPPSMLFSAPSTPSPPPMIPPTPTTKQGLLAGLAQVKDRYQDLQKAFRDCNVTLKDLKKDLPSLPQSADMSAVIRTAVERLDDYNEDARVELEIRIADEERILTGYETLLSVAGALDDDMDERKLQDAIAAFVDGTDPAVARATQQFTRKLDDLEHDIACVKRALHDLPAAPGTPPKHAQGWSAWTAGILGGGARPVSPAPTFGSVMTTPRARLASFSAPRPSPPDADERADPFAGLGLRIPMPAHVVPAPAPQKGAMFMTPMGGARAPRPRVSSASLFALGLGARGGSFAFGSPASTPGKSPGSALAKASEKGDSTEEEEDSDIE